jgi:hypothetical protein
MADAIPSLITTGLVVVSVIFPLLSLASIVLRFKARRHTKLPLQADDWWIVATWVSWMFKDPPKSGYYPAHGLGLMQRVSTK